MRSIYSESQASEALTQLREALQILRSYGDDEDLGVALSGLDDQVGTIAASLLVLEGYLVGAKTSSNRFSHFEQQGYELLGGTGIAYLGSGYSRLSFQILPEPLVWMTSSSTDEALQRWRGLGGRVS